MSGQPTGDKNEWIINVDNISFVTQSRPCRFLPTILPNLPSLSFFDTQFIYHIYHLCPLLTPNPFTTSYKCAKHPVCYHVAQFTICPLLTPNPFTMFTISALFWHPIVLPHPSTSHVLVTIYRFLTQTLPCRCLSTILANLPSLPRCCHCLASFHSNPTTLSSLSLDLCLGSVNIMGCLLYLLGCRFLV
jgi:hypothetical protein